MASKAEQVQVNGDDLVKLLERLEVMRKDLGLKRKGFAVALTFAAMQLCEDLNIKVEPVPEIENDGQVH